MLLKFFSRGTGKGAGGVEYITRKDDPISKRLRDPAPEVLRNGDPAMTIRLIDQLNFKHKYTSGVISFAIEDAPTQIEQSQLMSEFEKHAFAGLESDAYNILWVRHTHTDKNRVELHFIVPMVELNSGKSLNIAPPGWQGYFKPWQTYWNLKRGWARPDDLQRARVSSPGYEAYINKERQSEGKPPLFSSRAKVTQLIEQKIELGLIRNRTDIVQTLKDNNYEILRTTSRSITIKNPDWQGSETSPQARIRLKSGVFYADWTAEQREQTANSDRDRELKRSINKSLKQIEAKFNYRAERNQKRYPSKDYQGESTTVVPHRDLQEFMSAQLGLTGAIAPKNYPSNLTTLREERDRLKRKINLVEYAQSLGYFRTSTNPNDGKISYLTHTTDGERISIRTRPNDYDQYVMIGSEREKLTVIDLVQKRQNVGLTEVSSILQNYYDTTQLPQPETIESTQPKESDGKLMGNEALKQVLISMGRLQQFTTQELIEDVVPRLVRFLNQTGKPEKTQNFRIPNGNEYQVSYDPLHKRLSLKQSGDSCNPIFSAVWNERQYIADSPERLVELETNLANYLFGDELQQQTAEQSHVELGAITPQDRAANTQGSSKKQKQEENSSQEPPVNRFDKFKTKDTENKKLPKKNRKQDREYDD